MTGTRQALGRWGEDLAAAYLQQRGMVILERNFRGKRGEVDIIARDGDDLVFVEVKTRSSCTFGTPQEAVNRRKQQQIIHLAEIYLQSHPSRLQPRFDVVAVTAAPHAEPLVEHLPNAFTV